MAENNPNAFTGTLGSADCPCIDPRLTAERPLPPPCTNDTTSSSSSLPFPECAPPDYGTSCTMHDLFYDPKCTTTEDHVNVPGYCHETWCYVDLEVCRNATELIYKSSYWPESGWYYSYTTCGSQPNPFLLTKTTELTEGKVMVATVPESWYPFSYKLNATGEQIEYDGPEYWNNSIPSQGAVISYLDAIYGISTIGEIEYTHRSRGSSLAKPGSVYTASVHDVVSGLSDFGAGVFWITSERLEMTTFTVPIDVDRVTIWIRKPSTVQNFQNSAGTLVRPFTPSLWVLLFSLIFVTSVFSVWFANKNGPHSGWYDTFHSDYYRNGSLRKKARIGWPVLTASVMMNFTYFFANGVEFNLTSSYSFKLLMIGFAFVIMISYSAYVAKLAAYLTIEATSGYVKSMDEAIKTGLVICAPAALKTEIRNAWPKAKFVFNEEPGIDYITQMLNSYDRKQCTAIATTNREIGLSLELQDKICERNLVSTGALVIEQPIAMPANHDIAAGLSYWFTQGRKLGIAYQDFEELYRPIQQCPLSVDDDDEGGVKSYEPANMTMPLVFFLFFLIWAIAVKIKEDYCTKKVKRKLPRSSTKLSDYGRDIMKSTLEIDVNDDVPIPLGKRPPTRAQRRNGVGNTSNGMSFARNSRPPPRFPMKLDDDSGDNESDDFEKNPRPISKRVSERGDWMKTSMRKTVSFRDSLPSDTDSDDKILDKTTKSSVGVSLQINLPNVTDTESVHELVKQISSRFDLKKDE